MIHTRYLKATDTKGERIVARAGYSRQVFGWDYALTELENHAQAAAALTFTNDVTLIERDAHGFLFEES